MSAQSITNAIGRITMNPRRNIPVSTQIVEAVTDYLREENLNNHPKRAMAIISKVISHVRKRGEVLLQTQEGKFGSEKARTQFENGIRGSIDMIVDRLDKKYNEYLADDIPVDAQLAIVIPARLDKIRLRLLEFQKNQSNHGKFKQMADEATALIAELEHIQGELPSTESAIYNENTKIVLRGLQRSIGKLLKALNSWHKYFKTTAVPLVRAPMIQAPPSKEGGRKTRKRRRKRKRKTRKHRQKKRTRRRKPKKRHRRTRRK
tara:strand:- start:685 stop:1470 length:786 start_codon:yes stop_codon:yes gene_type:complete